MSTTVVLLGLGIAAIGYTGEIYLSFDHQTIRI